MKNLPWKNDICGFWRFRKLNFSKKAKHEYYLFLIVLFFPAEHITIVFREFKDALNFYIILKIFNLYSGPGLLILKDLFLFNQNYILPIYFIF